jgi:hypothetical protein
MIVYITLIIIIITYQNITKNTQHKKKKQILDISLYEMNTEVIMFIANVGQLIVKILAIR